MEPVELRGDLVAVEPLAAEVHRHEMRRRDGSWRDSVHYSILRSEWPGARKRLLKRLRAEAS